MGRHSANPVLRVIEAIRADPDDFAAQFYNRLFWTEPELRELFPAGMGHQRAALVAVLDHVFDSIAHTRDLPGLINILGQLGRDHRKFGVHSEHYDAFYRVLLEQIQRAVGTDWDDAIAGPTSQALLLVTGTMRGAAESVATPAVVTATVIAKRRVTRDRAVVRLRADAPLRFPPGGYLETCIPQWPRTWRNLSPASPPNLDGQLDFQVKAIPSGSFSTAIVQETAVGDVWQFAQTHGSFTLHPDRELVLVAGGTGLAPLRSLVIAMADNARNPRTRLFYGAKYPGELVDLDTLVSIASQNPWLEIIAVAEEETNPWWIDHPGAPTRYRVPIRHGRLLDVVGRADSLLSCDVFLAGPPAMIRATRDHLTDTGVPPERIQHDPLP